MSMLNDLYLVDGKKLNVIIWGQAGSGKTFFISNTVSGFLKQTKDPMYRVIYISPKQENPFEDIKGLKKSIEPIRDLNKVEKHLSKNRIAVFYPDPEWMEMEVDEMIHLIFNMHEANPGMKSSVIIDDAQVFLSSRKAASPAHLRLALTGRSVGIRAVYTSHSITFNKALEGQISKLVGFTNPLPIYWKDAERRYGYSPGDYAEQIASKPYSFVFFDTLTRQGQLMAPLEV